MSEHTDKLEGGEGIASVAIAFRVLEEIAKLDQPVGVSELARTLGEQKARVQRHLTTLRKLGVLTQDAQSRYRLGWALVELGQASLRQFDLVAVAEPEVKALRDSTRLTSALAIVVGNGLKIAFVAESHEMLSVTIRTGLSVPLFGSAAGRLLRAFQTPAEADGSPAEDLRPVREQRFACSTGEIRSGVNSVAAPICGPHGNMVAALVCAGTHTQIGEPPDTTLTDTVKRLADQIAAKLSGN